MTIIKKIKTFPTQQSENHTFLYNTYLVFNRHHTSITSQQWTPGRLTVVVVGLYNDHHTTFLGKARVQRYEGRKSHSSSRTIYKKHRYPRPRGMVGYPRHRGYYGGTFAGDSIPMRRFGREPGNHKQTSIQKKMA